MDVSIQRAPPKGENGRRYLRCPFAAQGDIIHRLARTPKHEARSGLLKACALSVSACAARDLGPARTNE